MISRNSGALCALLLTITAQAASVLPGNLKDGTASFTFPLGAHAYDENKQIFFTTAAATAGGSGQVNEYAVSILGAENSFFTPLAGAKARVNGSADQVNPLYDAGIQHIGLVYGQLTMGQPHPVVVSQNNPGGLYFLDSLDFKNPAVLAFPFVGDATANPTDGIIALSKLCQDYMLMAVKPTNSGLVFGDPGSGLALGALNRLVLEDGKNMRVFTMVDTVSGAGVAPNQLARAFPFDRTTASLAVGNPLSTLGSVVDIHYSFALNCFYIAVQLTTGAQSTDGGRAIVIGRVNKASQLTLSPIVPDAVIDTGADQIVAARGANSAVSVRHVRTMYTTTRLHYLIVVGGNGGPNSVLRSVYALPLVSNSADGSLVGTVANKNSAPVGVAASTVPFQFIRRDFTSAAMLPADMTRVTDEAARIGGADLPAGDITDIFVREDAVFVTVGNPANADQQPGIFQSQAIFATDGAIKGWTDWRRVGGTTDQVFAGAYQARTGDLLYATGANVGTVDTVRRTQWGVGADDGRANMIGFINQIVPESQGGVQKSVNIPQVTPGILEASYFLVSGKDTLALIETGQVVGGVLVPNAGNFIGQPAVFTNGAITQTLPIGQGSPKAVVLSGGALATIGSICAATVARDGVAGTNGWLFVGGVDGVAVLSNADGSGWDTTVGLGPDFAGLQDGMTFKSFGNYTYVRALINDGSFLYVLTDTALDRIDLTQGTPGLSIMTPVTVATEQGLSATFTDCLVSGQLALLGTTRGLFRIGNGADISTIDDQKEADWTAVVSQEGLRPVQQLYPITKTGRAQDLANGLLTGGNVYVLHLNHGKYRSQINRLTVAPVTESIDDATVQIVPDFFVKTDASYFLNFGSLRTSFATDGALFLAAHQGSEQSYATVTTPQMMGWFSNLSGALQNLLPVSFVPGKRVSDIVFETASGSWVIGGDFGLRINE